MAALEDITAELSKLTIDISSAELSHGEVNWTCCGKAFSNFTMILMLTVTASMVL